MNPTTLAPTDLSPAALAELVDSWLAGKSKHTVRAYRRNLAAFAAWTGDGSITEAARRLLTGTHGQANHLALRWRAELEGRGLASQSVAQALAALRSLVSLAQTIGMVPWSLSVKSPKWEPYRDTRGPGKEAVTKMLGVLEKLCADSPTESNVRDRALVYLCFNPALRNAEVCALDVGDYDPVEQRVRITGKGRRDSEWVTLPPRTHDALLAWSGMREGREGDPLFTSVNNGSRLREDALRGVVREVSGWVKKPTTPHGLRHTAITMLCAAGAPLVKVQAFSRHKSIETLRWYLDNAKDAAGEMASALETEVVT